MFFNVACEKEFADLVYFGTFTLGINNDNGKSNNSQ